MTKKGAAPRTPKAFPTATLTPIMKTRDSEACQVTIPNGTEDDLLNEEGDEISFGGHAVLM